MLPLLDVSLTIACTWYLSDNALDFAIFYWKLEFKFDRNWRKKILFLYDQGVNKPELVTDCMEGSRAIVTISETKLAIEKLLAQETFSR